MIKTIIASKKMLVLTFICLEFIFAYGKDKLTKIELEKKNPIEYVFNISKDSLYKVIFNQLRIDNTMLWDKAHKYMVLKKLSVLLEQSEENSAFCLMPTTYLGKSWIYFDKKGTPLNYTAWFYLHIKSIDGLHSQITVTTIDSKIVIGKEMIPKPPHFVRKDKTLAVEPSTIEEYEILLEIGKLVGEKGMPPLSLPEKK